MYRLMHPHAESVAVNLITLVLETPKAFRGQARQEVHNRAKRDASGDASRWSRDLGGNLVNKFDLDTLTHEKPLASQGRPTC